MYTIIFAGGHGTRLYEETRKIPKPMVRIGNTPILEHIINIYASQKYKKFIILTGYKHEEIKKYFKKKKYFINNLNSNSRLREDKNRISLNLLYTGLKSNKLQRLNQAKKYLSNEKLFFLTYGDGLSNVSLSKLLREHIRGKNIITLTAINPSPRFGLLEIKKKKIVKFEEKKIIKDQFVNGGFFVCDTELFKLYESKNKNLDFEENILNKLAIDKKLGFYKHNSFWYSMDTLRDKIYLNNLLKNDRAPWI